MKVDVMIDIVQGLMSDNGVYRTDEFVLELINDAHKLLAVFTLYYELSTSEDLDGTRNYVAFPEVDGKQCLAPLYVSDGVTGARINPVELEEFEFYQSQWEGTVNTAPLYYTTTGRHSPAHSGMVFCPIGNYGRAKYYFAGAYVPADLISGDTLALTDLQQKAVIDYCTFMCYVSEPARGPDALEAYKSFMGRLGELTSAQTRRFPSGRDTEPVPVEFKQLSTVRYEKRQPSDTKEADNEG